MHGRTHRVLIECSSQSRPTSDSRGTEPVRRLRTGSLTVSPAVRSAAPRFRADRGPGRPAGTPGGGPPDRHRSVWGARTHPGPAAYREDREHTVPRPTPHATGHVSPNAPGTPHTYVQGMHGLASGQTSSSLPPRTPLLPQGCGRPHSLATARNRVPGRGPYGPLPACSGPAPEPLRTRPGPFQACSAACPWSPPARSASAPAGVSGRMSIRQPVSRAARRAFCPSFPMASDSW